MVGNAASGTSKILSIYFFPFFTGLWLQLEKRGNEDVPLKFYPEINSEITQALVLLKLSGQLEKAPREPCCDQSALCFSAGTVKQVTGRASVL